MKIVGLIAEYNPFHNGHLYHIEEAKRITGADTAIVVMSGDYVQRGMPAIMPKRVRAEMALKCGAAAVFELPVCYATASAELFAAGAVSLLDQLGIVDAICFGSECNDINAMQNAAKILCEEPEAYRTSLRESLRSGKTFPAARREAILKYTGDPLCADLLNDPNNILGIEYLKALIRLDSAMTPYTILRKGAPYHSQNLDKTYSSASAIRSLLAHSGSLLNARLSESRFDSPRLSSLFGALEGQVPPCCMDLLKDAHKVLYPVYQNDFSLILKYKLLNKEPESLLRYMDVSKELANRICANLNHFFNYSQFCELLKTKELTQTRIHRALLHIMLGTKKIRVENAASNGYHFYARLLGVRKDSVKILSMISRQSNLPLLTKLSAEHELSPDGQLMLRHDILASNLYTSVITDKYKTPFQNEYKQAIVKV